MRSRRAGHLPRMMAIQSNDLWTSRLGATVSEGSGAPHPAPRRRQNYAKYKEIVDRAAALTTRDVRFEACRNAAAAQGFAAEDLHGFVTVVPAGPYALAYYKANYRTNQLDGREH